jgi:hypothetical protein
VRFDVAKGADNILKCAPIVFSGAHAVLAVLVFWFTIADPERRGLLPIILFFADFPCSIFMNWLRKSILQSNLWVDAAVYVIIGSAWWYAIGWVLAAAIGKLKGERVLPQAGKHLKEKEVLEQRPPGSQ